MNTLPDDHVRELVTSTGLDRTLFVEAGAGTGKTTALVRRIVGLVLEQDVPLANIAAITFTEAAAAELQSRIRVAFERRLADEQDAEIAARCRAAIADSDRAAISTLHGFASRILGEFAVEAGLPPRVHVLDEVSSGLAHEERWERFVDRLYDDPQHHEMLLRASLLGIHLEARSPNQPTFKKVAAQLNDNWDRLDDVVTWELPAIEPFDFTPFEAALDAVRDLVEQCVDEDDRLHRAIRDQVLPRSEAALAIADPNRRFQALRELEFKFGNLGRAAAWRCGRDVALGCVKALAEATARIEARATDAVLRRLLILTAREVRQAARERQAEGGLEFHDLLVLARELLRSSATARSVLHDRYRHLLLDEFQDTDPIQIELATLIAATIVDGEPGGWDELDVGEGRLFFVGDPKQSIYRFRRADISLFLAARERFAGEHGVQQLTTNFRTVGPIIDWVNHLFTRVMGEGSEGSQPEYRPLAADRSGRDGADHRPVLLGGPHPDRKVPAGVLRQEEAEDVARVIEAIRARPSEWPVHDPEVLGGWRDARLSDVTILVPARTSVPYLRTALGEANVPYRLATGTLVYDTQEVRDALAAIRAIDDPTDQLSLVAALRSPLYACTDVDLHRYRQQGGRWELHRPVRDTVPADSPVRAALDHLRSLWEDRWWSTPSALLDRLLRERRADLLAFGEARPEEVWRRLRFLVDQARAFEEAGGGGLREFVEWATLQGSDGARVHEPLLPETGEDAVQILTIHGAKGLEFPITILSGMTTRPGGRRRGVSVLWDDDHRPEVGFTRGLATGGHEPRSDLEAEMDGHEKLRLLYVAATRARDHLIVSCHHQANGRAAETYGGRIWAELSEHRELWRRFEVDAPVPHGGSTDGEQAADDRSVPPSLFDGSAPIDDDAVAAASAAEREAWIRTRDAALAPWRRRRILSATSVAALAGDHHATDDAPSSEAALDEPASDDEAIDLEDLERARWLTPRRRGRAGSAIGRAVHASLQLVDLADPKDLEAQAARQCDLEGIPDLLPTVVAAVQSALASPIITAAASGVHHKELFVSAPIGDRAIEGYVDLLWESPDGLVIIDYKTDAVRSDADVAARVAHHRLQGAAYALALQHVTGERVAGCHFVFCSADGARERAIDDLAAAMAEVEALLRT